MQCSEILIQRLDTDYQERLQALNEGLDRLLNQIFGCSHGHMSRPFTRNNKTYRVCMSCGKGRSFDLKTWKTFDSSSK